MYSDKRRRDRRTRSNDAIEGREISLPAKVLECMLLLFKVLIFRVFKKKTGQILRNNVAQENKPFWYKKTGSQHIPFSKNHRKYTIPKPDFFYSFNIKEDILMGISTELPCFV